MQQWKCGRFALEIGRKTYVMGIVNATPDSFSGDGVSASKAVESALRMIDEGADVLDIGGESTRPGSEKVTVEEELERVLPVIEALAPQISIPISIDTTKAEVARRAIEAGASIVNDISGATFDTRMLEVCVQSDCGLILMHLRGTPQSMEWSRNFGENADIIAEILAFWQERLKAASVIGIGTERICFDAGFGFGKSVEENLEIISRGKELRALGFPLLSGTSRKSTIGRVLGGAEVGTRLLGTAATVALAIESGADMVRVHDVREMRDVVLMSDAICRKRHL